MYFAFTTVQDDHHDGSTKLYMDLTDATNMMLSSAIGPDGKVGCALWLQWSWRFYPFTTYLFDAQTTGIALQNIWYSTIHDLSVS